MMPFGMVREAVRHFQPMCIHETGVREESFRRTIRDDPSVIEQ